MSRMMIVVEREEVDGEFVRVEKRYINGELVTETRGRNFTHVEGNGFSKVLGSISAWLGFSDARLKKQKAEAYDRVHDARNQQEYQNALAYVDVLESKWEATPDGYDEYCPIHIGEGWC